MSLIHHNSYEPGLIRQSLSYWLHWASHWVIESTCLSSKSIPFPSTYSITRSSPLLYSSTCSSRNIPRSSQVGPQNTFEHISKSVSQRRLTLGPKHMRWMDVQRLQDLVRAPRCYIVYGKSRLPFSMQLLWEVHTGFPTIDIATSLSTLSSLRWFYGAIPL